MKMLEQVLGKKTADRLTEGTYIARGHLAPDADFIFGSWQFLTYFYANVAPQWQSINAGNWLATEKNVRKKAIELNRDLTVYTGTQGILTIEGKQLYLEPKKKQVPIPENFWKLLFDELTKQGIAIIGSNNPPSWRTRRTSSARTSARPTAGQTTSASPERVLSTAAPSLTC